MKTNPDYYEKSVDNDVSLDIKNHWISCNVYPQSRKWVQKQVKYHFLKFKYLKNYSKMKRKTLIGESTIYLLQNSANYLTVLVILVGLKDKSYFGV